MDSVVQAALIKAGVPGAALVVVRGDRAVHVRGFGRADDRGRPVTPDTPFYLGSTTKSFTALAILQLVEAGRVDLDAPVQRYLPWFTLADSAVSRGITVRQLLVHRGGIPGRAGERFLADDDTSAAAAERHVRWLAGARPVTGFSYSNLSYTTLGLIVEAASGMPYATYLRTHVFEPLGMQHTHTERADAELDGLAQGYAIVLGHAFPCRQPADRGDLAAGYLMSSAGDVGQYLIAHVNAGRVPGRPGVSPDAIRAMHESRGSIVADREIAFGFSITTLDSVRILDISGSVPTYLSRFVIAPDSGVGIALLANGNSVLADFYVMEAALNAARMALGKRASPVEAPLLLLVPLVLFFGLPVAQLGLAWWTARRLAILGNRRVWLWAAINAGWGLLVLFGAPFLFQTYWPTMRAYQPALAAALLASGWFALVWAVVRTALAIRAKSSHFPS
jgi:CubicO group peptidase (beta-lactamase class C family)